jgi:tRNA (guanosine-2'-O-)-methyltransferase
MRRPLALAAIPIAACGPAAKPPAAPDLQPSKVTGGDGVDLVMACTPTGPELCFNAVDDNCNGVIDEGCGMCTGPLQFTIAWGEAAADADLIVTDPNGGRVSPASPASPSGLKLDHSCPAEGCSGQNFENACFEGGGEPPRGKYVVEVKLANLGGAPSPLKVRIGARVGRKTFGADLELSTSDDKRSFTFEL